MRTTRPSGGLCRTGRLQASAAAEAVVFQMTVDALATWGTSWHITFEPTRSLTLAISPSYPRHWCFTRYLTVMLLLIFEAGPSLFLVTFATLVLCNEWSQTLAAGIPRTSLSSPSLSLPTTSTASSANRSFSRIVHKIQRGLSEYDPEFPS